jgi:hypothetical protein
MSATLHRNAGMASAVEGSPYFAAAAYAAIVAVAKRQATVHVDDVLAECSAQPHHFNAWGGVWMSAIRNGVITRTGMLQQCRVDRGKHAHAYPLYRSCLFGEPASAVE